MNYCKANDNTKSISSFFLYIYIAGSITVWAIQWDSISKTNTKPRKEGSMTWQCISPECGVSFLSYFSGCWPNTWQKASQVGKAGRKGLRQLRVGEDDSPGGKHGDSSVRMQAHCVRSVGGCYIVSRVWGGWHTHRSVRRLAHCVRNVGGWHTVSGV